MSTIQHSSLTGSQLHEPKGISTASANTFSTIISNAVTWQPFYAPTASTLSSTASVAYTGFSGVSTLILTFDDVLTSASTTILLQVSSDNGSSYENATIYKVALNQDGTSVGSGGHQGITLDGNDNSNYRSGKIILANFNKTQPSLVKGHIGQHTSTDLGGSHVSYSLLGLVDSSTAWDALRVIPVSGNLTSGTIVMQAIRA